MSVLNLDVATFQEVIARQSLVAIGFAPLGKVPSGLEALGQRHPEATVGQVDPQRAPGVAAMFGVAEGPALLIFRDEVVMYLEPSIHDSQKIEELLVRVQALDMRAVRAEIEERKQAEAALKMRRVCPRARRARCSEAE